LSEMTRVTKSLVLLGTPVTSEIVTRVDRIIFDFIWGKYAHEFEPLRQHVQFGLEPLEDVIASLKAQCADRVVALPDNYVYRLIHQILIFFDLQYENPFSKFYESVNRIYNERIGPYDYREPCYRYLMVVATDPALDLDVLEETMKGPCETPESIKQAEGALVEAFRAAESRTADELRGCLGEINQLRHDLWLKEEEIKSLKISIRQLSERS